MDRTRGPAQAADQTSRSAHAQMSPGRLGSAGREGCLLNQTSWLACRTTGTPIAADGG